MVRVKRYLEEDVLTAARSRIRHVYDVHDSVAVMFSGGKDSLVCLHLAKEVHEERGLGPVRVVFRDEELIPDVVIETVDHYRRQPWVAMTWYAVPLRGDKFVLGQSSGYVQWDPNRAHVRDVPAWAVTLKDLSLPPETVLDQYSMDALAAKGLPGLCAFVTGVRASESLVRYRSVVNKLNENYICATGAKNVKLAKPIYDWSEADVFKFILDGELRYCSLYDTQHLAGQNLRVSTPVHSEAAKRIDRWRAMDAKFYERLLRVFPEMELQERYWRDWDSKARAAKYPETWEGCEAFIEDHFAGASLEHAKDRLAEFLSMARNNPAGFTPAKLLGKLASGTVKRVIW